MVAEHHPELWQAFAGLVDTTWASDALPVGVLELCRLRIATLLGDPGPARLRTDAPAAALEAKVAALSRWPDAEVFDDTDRACLAFAEQFVLDVQGITADVAAPVVAAVGGRGYTTLVLGCGMAEALARSAAVLGDDPLRVTTGPGSADPVA